MPLRAPASSLWSYPLEVREKLWEIKGRGEAKWLLWAVLSTRGIFLSIILKLAEA